MSTLVGFSPQTWTKAVRDRAAEIHHVPVHGNTVSKSAEYLAPSAFS